MTLVVSATDAASAHVRDRIGHWLSGVCWPAGLPTVSIVDAVGGAVEAAVRRTRRQAGVEEVLHDGLLRIVVLLEPLPGGRRRVRAHVCDPGGPGGAPGDDGAAWLAAIAGSVDHVVVRWSDLAVFGTEVLLISRSVPGGGC